MTLLPQYLIPVLCILVFVGLIVITLLISKRLGEKMINVWMILWHLSVAVLCCCYEYLTEEVRWDLFNCCIYLYWDYFHLPQRNVESFLFVF